MNMNGSNISFGINKCFEFIDYFKCLRIYVDNSNLADSVIFSKTCCFKVNY